MTVAKLHFKVGAVEFSGEGDEKWLSNELAKVIKALPELCAVAARAASENGEDKSQETQTPRKGKVGSLASYISKANGGTNQIARFLATAVWLHDKGAKRIATSDVRKALSENSQRKLNNPADCLNQLVRKGDCEKDGKQFFVTDDGRKSAGH